MLGRGDRLNEGSIDHGDRRLNGGSKKSCRVSQAIIRMHWLLPGIYVAVKLGSVTVKSLSDHLGCSRRLASTLLYYMAREGLVRRVRGSEFSVHPEIARCLGEVRAWRGYYGAIVGSTVVIAKVSKRRIRSYTLTKDLLGRTDLEGKLGYRVRKARRVLGLD